MIKISHASPFARSAVLATLHAWPHGSRSFNRGFALSADHARSRLAAWESACAAFDTMARTIGGGK